jgi:DNA-binding NtrC family response regulator/cellulose biosynthesis protein BcsQ
MAGSVITFYSFKGGVGRSLALANVGVVLARWGYRVLCVDWDLEAPGLHHYFGPWMGRGWTSGLLDLIEEVGDGEKPEWLESVNVVTLPGEPTPLNLLCAGTLDDKYFTRLQAVSWDDLYQQHDLGGRLEEMRSEWKARYDFILVDSRTGISDTGGICTIQMPDRLVLLATASRQSVDGIVDVARRASARRAKLPYDRAALACIPVVARFDGRVERELSLRWLDDLAEAFAPFYGTWLHRAATARQLMDVLRIPYVARYSYGEDLPVVEESTRDPEGMGYSYETLAALLARNLDDTDLLINRRDSYVAAARREVPHSRGFVFDVLINDGGHYPEAVRLLEKEFHRQGLRPLSVGDLPDRSLTLEQAIAQSCHFVFLLGADAPQVRQLLPDVEDVFRELTKQAERDRRIVPVLMGDVQPERLPPAVRSFARYHFRGEAAALVSEIALSKAVTADAETEIETPPVYGPLMQDTLVLAKRAAASNINVLILGEIGAGKEWLAQFIHDQSPRSKRPMSILNCGSLSEALMESELFGFEKGAFTGANRAKQGAIEAASGGTILLDEIDQMPLAAQARLLRVLETREVLPVGAVRPRAVDVRFIATTSRDLEADVVAGRYRRDLYFRLNGISLTMPPLRERVVEIAGLARLFAREASRAAGTPAKTLSLQAIRKLELYHWPGNIRELKNVIERAVILCEGEKIGLEHLSIDLFAMMAAPGDEQETMGSTLEALRKNAIIDALTRSGGNQTRAATTLGVSRRTLSSWLHKYNLTRPGKTESPEGGEG